MVKPLEVPSPDKKKYFEIIEDRGLSAALTQLHEDLWVIECEAFEGASGYRPEVFEIMNEYRELSLELWNSRYETEAIYRRQKEINTPSKS